MIFLLDLKQSQSFTLLINFPIVMEVTIFCFLISKTLYEFIILSSPNKKRDPKLH